MIMNNLLTEDKVPTISLQQARDEKMLGPVYHGTTEEKRTKIGDEGFKVFVGAQGKQYGHSDVSHGYEFSDYHGGLPAPIHHLGYGIYFTTVKAIAKQYSMGTTKGMKTYFLRVPKLEIINFGSQSNMMKWWIKNGYDYKPPYDVKDGAYKDFFFGRAELQKVEHERVRATVHMTEELKSKWDAVWFKGKGMHRLLDGDQVVVFDPSNIFQIDLSLSKGFDIGAKVVAKQRIAHLNYAGEEYRRVEAGDKGIIIGKQDVTASRVQYPHHWAKRADKYVLDVKFKNAGRQQVEDIDVEPLMQ